MMCSNFSHAVELAPFRSGVGRHLLALGCGFWQDAPLIKVLDCLSELVLGVTELLLEPRHLLVQLL